MAKLHFFLAKIAKLARGKITAAEAHLQLPMNVYTLKESPHP
jgi:hypothetical protein